MRIESFTNFKDTNNNISSLIEDRNIHLGIINGPKKRRRRFIKSFITSAFTGTNAGPSQNKVFFDSYEYTTNFTSFKLKRPGREPVLFGYSKASSPNKQAKTIINFEGAGAQIDNFCKQPDYNNIIVARPDCSILEESKGVVNLEQLAQNYIDVINHAKEKYNLENKDIILNAFSIGNVLMSKVLHHIAVTEKDPQKRKFGGIVFQTPYTSLSKIVKHNKVVPKFISRLGDLALKSFSSTYRNDFSVVKSLGNEGLELLRENQENIFTYLAPGDNIITQKPSRKFIRFLNNNNINSQNIEIDDTESQSEDAGGHYQLFLSAAIFNDEVSMVSSEENISVDSKIESSSIKYTNASQER